MTEQLLATDRIRLRPLEQDDAERLRSIVNHPDVLLPLGYHSPFSLEQEQSFITERQESDSAESYVIVLKDNSSVIGSIGIENIRQVNRTAEVGYMLHPDHHGKGIGTAALECMIEYAFRHRNLAKLWAKAKATNTASHRLLEKCGFTREGIQADQLYADGERIDQHLFGLTREQWQSGS